MTTAGAGAGARVEPVSEATAGPSLDREVFRRLARLVHRESGIRLTEAKRSLIVSRLSRRLRALGLSDFAEYCALVEAEAGAEERGRMISALTTNVTRFFREEHHFRQLRDEILPPLIAHARAGGRVRLWSAGCSTGEEPYSLAITLVERFPDAAAHDVRILASDIDPCVIETARRGRYPASSAAALPAELRRRYLMPCKDAPDQVELEGTLRALISFRELNLLSRWPFRGRFDVIMCRNVVIYFDAPTQEMLWPRFAEALAPGGHLFIGHSERLTSSAASLFRNTGVTAYRRAGPEAPESRCAGAGQGDTPKPARPSPGDVPPSRSGRTTQWA